MASDGTRRPRLIEVEVSSGRTWIVNGVSETGLEDGYISTARLIQFPTTQGDFAYGYLYTPKVKSESSESRSFRRFPIGSGVGTMHETFSVLVHSFDDSFL